MNKEVGGINFIVCGLEHSGTTLVSDLLRQLPGCDSGFECGVLLVNQPSEFSRLEPFVSNILKGWEITRENLKLCLEKSSFNEFYDELYERSQLFSSSEAPSIRFDKTPRYIAHIQKVSQRASGKPILAMMKDPRAILWSDFKRSGHKIDKINAWYDEWLPAKKRYMEAAYSGYEYCMKNSDQCLVVKLEDLCFCAQETLKKIDHFLELEYNPLQFHLSSKRYMHTKGNSIDISTAVEHLASLPTKISLDVANELKHLDRWFYNFN